MIAALALFTSLALPAPSLALTQNFLAGLIDDFAPPADPAEPSSELEKYISDLGFTLLDFDLEVRNNFVASTFDFPVSSQEIIGGNLAFQARACPIGCATNDRLILGWTIESGEDFVVGYDVMLSDLAGMDWNNGVQDTFDLDLANLPNDNGGLSLLAQLNEFGFLDVLVFDDTAVDYYALEIERVPEPSTAVLLILGLGGLAGVGSRRRRA